ncbi:MAG: lipoprotein insertase outer membrane protein LolB [Pseudomonadota bacterium]
MSIKNAQFLILTFFILLISACAVKPDISATSDINRVNDINQHWKIKGRLAIITTDERKSAYLAWQQRDTEFDMVLNTLVGSNIATLKYDGTVATLEVDDEFYEDTSPELLLLRATGWYIPASLLPIWITGQASADDKTTYYDNGLLKSLEPRCQSCSKWRIQYEKYGSFDFAGKEAVALPSRLTLQSESTKLIIRIDDWRAL